MALLENRIEVDLGEASPSDLSPDVIRALGSPVQLQQKLHDASKRGAADSDESNSSASALIDRETLGEVMKVVESVILLEKSPSESAINALRSLIARRPPNDGEDS